MIAMNRAGAPIAGNWLRKLMRSAGGVGVLILVFCLPAGAQLSTARAPFNHKAHKSVKCQLCHEKADGQGELKVATALNCKGCHHATLDTKRCAACHPASRLKPFVRALDAPPAGEKLADSRRLTFAHSTHASLTCTTCHTNKSTLGAVPSCTSCHDDHHAAQRNCASCHDGVLKIKEHTRAAHGSCAGAGCHKTTVTGSLRTQRNTCLVCHTDKVNHKSGRECADCHMVRSESAKP